MNKVTISTRQHGHGWKAIRKKDGVVVWECIHVHLSRYSSTPFGISAADCGKGLSEEQARLQIMSYKRHESRRQALQEALKAS